MYVQEWVTCVCPLQVVDEDPLNSDDDVGDDAEEQKDFDTNDTIVCLWEKVGQWLSQTCS